MERPLIGVMLASRSDFNVMRRALETLRVMGVPYLFDLASPHRMPERVAKFVAGAAEAGVEVFIAASGGNGQLPGMIACHTLAPVIGVPIDSTPLRGEDSLLGMVQMPPGSPVAVVGVNSAENAAVLAVQMLSIRHTRLREVLSHRRTNAILRLDRSLMELVKEYPELCDPEQTAPKSRRQGLSEVDTDGGSEEVTPEPPPERTERIRPGATLLNPAAAAAAAVKDPSTLIATPLPQEPGVITEDSNEPALSQAPLHAHPSTGRAMAKLAAAQGPQPASSLNAPTAIIPLPGRTLAPAEPARITPVDPVRVPVAPLAEPPKPAPPEPLSGLPQGRRSPVPVPITPDPSALMMVAHKARETAPKPAATSKGPIDTRVFTVDPADPDVNVLEHAMLVLLEGGVVAMPTDTVYGLAADATNPAAVRALLELKGYDPAKKSLAMLIGDPSALDSLVVSVPGPLERVLDEFWPGGLTVLFQRKPSVLPEVTDSASLGLRVPDHPVALQLLMMVARPLAVINTSVKEGEPATRPDEVMARFNGRIDCVLDAGACESGAPSTVLSALIEPFEVLREGAVKRADLKRVLGDKLRG
jgi:tRNA threonylcarbamoyl adenosine modification protein (Sua5/YciO/YrdC/YwlC family)